ncbi:MAG TPA: hypothetical protein VE910_06105 [Dongiaceae bacterium]|nr:hypothetical protein [Dongiaceae bacterium]
MSRYARAVISLAVLAATAKPALAGVSNPNISVIGQPDAFWTDDPGNPDQKHVRLQAGEVETQIDDYLNPYARATFVLSLGEDGMDLEEGYFSLFRGLPLDLGLRGGKYRVPFGRLNQVHPHANPFAEPPEVIHAYLPGEEAYNEIGADLSRRFPIVGDFSINAQADWLQGDTFRIERESSGDPTDPLETGGGDEADQTRGAWLGRLSGFAMLGDQSALEFGASASQGTNNVAAKARTGIYGIDAKAKLWTSGQAYVVIQGEGLHLARDEASWDPANGYVLDTVNPTGGYLYADYNFGIRYNVGAMVEAFEEPTPDKPLTHAYSAFLGYSLLEETTAFRLDWRHIQPEDGESINTVTLRALFSLGPHKAHQF